MEKKEISVDEFLSVQEKRMTLATIEAVDGKTDFVKVTPWSNSGGCSCRDAITVPKKAIKSVTPTGDRHFCCGKTLLVVEVVFDTEATISVQEVFHQRLDAGMHAAEEAVSQAPFVPAGAIMASYTPPQTLVSYPQTDYPMASYPSDADYLYSSDAPDYFGDVADPAPDYLTAAGGLGNIGNVVRGPIGIPFPFPRRTFIRCGGNWYFVPIGSRCCGSRPIGPGVNCCNGQPCSGTCAQCMDPSGIVNTACIPRGQDYFCCKGQICPGGTRCVDCCGRARCLKPEETCPPTECDPPRKPCGCYCYDPRKLHCCEVRPGVYMPVPRDRPCPR